MHSEMMRAEIWLDDTLETQHGLEELAIRMGYSASQIRRRFREAFGHSPGAYRDTLRLEKAACRLILTPLDIKIIAASCGYRNHSAFTRAFQRRFRLTPRQFRQTKRLELYRQGKTIRRFHFRIVKLPARSVVVTRLYGVSSAIDELAAWQRYAPEASALPERLNNAPPVAILHDYPQACEMFRLDLGIEADASAAKLALPASFRQLQLPPQRHACLKLKSSNELMPAMLFMACHSLNAQCEYLSGDAPQLIKHAETLELRIPLLESA